MTATEMFLMAGGGAANIGPHRCYYCGAECDETHTKKEHVQDSFTNRDIVRFPASDYVCTGCVEASGAGPDTMEMIDGVIRERTNARGMQPRMYSWVIVPDHRWAATKAHIEILRQRICNPPEPPFVIVLADSGQKQLLFRAPVAFDRYHYQLMLEDEQIDVDVRELGHALEAADKVSTAIGKPALLAPVSMAHYIACDQAYGNVDALEEWATWRNTATGKLAAWLAKSKEKA